MNARTDIGGLGYRIRTRRNALRLTQNAVAKRLNVTAQAISKWETGMGCPDIYVLPELADVLQMSIDELLGVRPRTTETQSVYAAPEVETA